MGRFSVALSSFSLSEFPSNDRRLLGGYFQGHDQSFHIRDGSGRNGLHFRYNLQSFVKVLTEIWPLRRICDDR